MSYQFKTIQVYVLGIFIFFMSPLVVSGQDNYVLLSDASGFDRSVYEAELEAATSSLTAVIDEVNLYYDTELLDVKVFDFGFYLFNALYQNGIEDALNLAKQQASSASSQYLLFAKESNDNKIYSKLHFEVNLPEGHNCYTNERLRESIQEYIDYHPYNNSPFEVMDFQIELINLISNQIKVLYICCVPEGQDANISSRKKSIQLTSCDGVDLLAEHNEGLAKDYILNFLSCLDYSSNPLATTSPGEGLYASINNLSPSAVFNGCYLPDGIVHCNKTDDSNPSMFEVRIPTLTSIDVDCPNISGVPNLTAIDVWDYGAFKIYVRQDYDLGGSINELAEGEFLQELRDVIDLIYNTGNLSGENAKILGRGIGCQLSQLDFNYKLKLLQGLLEIDDQETILESIVNVFFTDYSSLLFYVIEAIDDYQSLFINLKGNPSTVSKLIEYDLDSGYEVDLKILILQKYKEVITNPETLLTVSDAVVIPFTVDKILVVFQNPNFDFNNDETNLRVNVTDYSSQSSYYTGYYTIKFDWESDYPEHLQYLDPLILPELEISGEEISFKNYIVPAFLMPSISTDIGNENVKQALLVAVDVSSLLIGGVGFFKLAATGVVRARQLKMAISGTQTVLGATNLFLRLNEDCQNNNTCREIATYLTILEIISITPDLYAVSKSALFKSVDDLVEVTADVSKVREIRAAQNLDYLNTRVDRLADVPSNLKGYLASNKVELHILNELSDDALSAVAKEIPSANFNSTMDKLVADMAASKNATGGTDDLIDFLNLNPGRVKAWKALDDIGVDQAIKTNITHLESVDSYFTKFPERTSTDLATTANQFDNVEDYLNVLPDIVNNSVIRGTRFDDFVSVSGLGSNFHQAEYTFHLWKSENWTELESFFNANNINNWNGTIWPPNFGFKNISHTETGSTLDTKVFDRFQGETDLGGSFASPVQSGEGIDDLVFTYDSRALGSAPEPGTYYIKFRLIDSPVNMNFDYGEAIPWFGTNGGGTQIKSSVNFGNLVEGVNYEVLEKMFYNGTNWIPQ